VPTPPPTAPDASTEDIAIESAPPDLPFAALLRTAEADGRVLHREDIYGSGPPVDMVSEEILDFVVANVGHRVLDVGCGIGPYVHRLRELGHDCIGIDTNTDAIEAGRRLGRPLEVASAYELDFADDSFDSVILVECLEHLPEYERALAEAARVARSTIVLTVPNIGVLPPMSKRAVVPWHILEATHINFFTPRIMEKTLLRFASRCETGTLGMFYEVDGEPMHMHVTAVAHL
jgi:SAM-dependent methyltransferase